MFGGRCLSRPLSRRAACVFVVVEIATPQRQVGVLLNTANPEVAIHWRACQAGPDIIVSSANNNSGAFIGRNRKGLFIAAG